MCLYCDLKSPKDMEKARHMAEMIIEKCQEIAFGYRQVLNGSIVPHTDEMTSLVSKERALVRLIIDDIL